MCGIVAVVRRPASGAGPGPSWIRSELAAAQATADGALDGDAARLVAELEQASARLAAVDQALRGTPALRALLESPKMVEEIETRAMAVEQTLASVEQALDSGSTSLSVGDVERVNAALVGVKDAAWAVGHDRVATARRVAALGGPAQGPAAVDGYWSVQVALSAINRLEVRGRDSAGLHVLVDGHGLDLDGPDVRRLLEHRVNDRLFTSTAARTPQGQLCIVYKVAAEIGELGDNVATLTAAVASDDLLRLSLEAATAKLTVLGHTRWASVGIISQANAHPLNHEEEDRPGGPYVVAALNGDVDNYAQLRASQDLRIPVEITTDAKVIPVLVSRRLAAGRRPVDAFRDAATSLRGSVAVAAQVADPPGQLMLALRGSGQALYVGLAEDSYVVASEPYGLVQETATYLRMDGETTGGQIVTLAPDRAGELAGITRHDYAGRELPATADDLQHAEITTRDVDRAGFAHFLLKEISEAPQSFRKTLRGKVRDDGQRLEVVLSDETLPPAVRARLAHGTIRRIVAIGQGTAAVAAQAAAAAIETALGRSPLSVSALPATELSAFALDDDMSDTLVVAVSQSGTTTDTNRTVDLVRARGAAVIGVVNRRHSDLVEKADGVLYTSDGRDVEMSVASTKAFYAQVAAGFLLACGIAAVVGDGNGDGETGRRRQRLDDSHRLLTGLRALPAAMEEVVRRREAVAQAAQRDAPARRNWAVVGNGSNRIAASEVRIKLSELCYKSIACDVTEDKKHIDLSSEPLVIVCAAGLNGANADDVAKEVAIYRAHKAAPVVIASDGEERFSAALHVIPVPAVDPDLAFVLSAMAGHLFGYEAALSIDAQAVPLREVRAAIEEVVASVPSPDDLIGSLRSRIQPAVSTFLRGVREGAYDGHLQAHSAVRLSSLLGYVTGALPLDAFEGEYGKAALPSVVVDELSQALSEAIDELTRPIDAIKHQAKTVTVGISRSEDALFQVPLVAQVLATAPLRDRLSYGALRTLSALDPAVAEVAGYTRYRVEGEVGEPTATIHVVAKGGVAEGLRSRTEANPVLRGTKRKALDDREVTVAVGLNDGRTVVLVPETKDGRAVGLTLLHVRLHDRLAAPVARDVLLGYRQARFDALRDAVTETEPEFDEGVLGELPVVDVLVAPVLDLAEHWRSGRAWPGGSGSGGQG